MDALTLPDAVATGVGEDVVSGQALPLLFDLASYPVVWSPAWSILLLCLLIGVSAVVSFALRDECNPQLPQTSVPKTCCPWDTVAGIVLSCVKVWLSASMLFRLVAALDPDVGVRLCVIPFLFLLSTQHGDPTTYRMLVHIALIGAARVRRRGRQDNPCLPTPARCLRIQRDHLQRMGDGGRSVRLRVPRRPNHTHTRSPLLCIHDMEGVHH